MYGCRQDLRKAFHWTGLDPWVGEILWRRERLPTPVFWPGEFHRLYSPPGGKESDRAERLSFFTECSDTFETLFVLPLQKWKYLPCKEKCGVQLCKAMDCSLPGFSVHEILQASMLEWVDIPFSRESPNPVYPPNYQILPIIRISQSRISNPGLPHCRLILYHLSHQGSLHTHTHTHTHTHVYKH